MADIDPRKFQVGEWVQVWGQVVESAGKHPSDELVEFFSHNEQWRGHVDRFRIEPAEAMPEFAQQCSALFERKPDRLLRCTRHDGHADGHDSGNQWWTDSDTYGHVEES